MEEFTTQLENVSLAVFPAENWFLGDAMAASRRGRQTFGLKETTALLHKFGELLLLTPNVWTVQSSFELGVLEFRSECKWKVCCLDRTESSNQALDGVSWLIQALGFSSKQWVMIMDLSVLNHQSLKNALSLTSHVQSMGHQISHSPACFISRTNSKCLSIPSVWPKQALPRILQLYQSGIESIETMLDQLPTIFFDYDPGIFELTQRKQTKAISSNTSGSKKLGSNSRALQSTHSTSSIEIKL